MAPTAAKRSTAPKTGKVDKPVVKHVQLGFAPVNGSQKPLRHASLTKFSVALPSPSSSQETLRKSPEAPARRKPSVKGKERADEVDNAQMWTDKFEPTTLDELAVHKRKVQDVQRWLEEAIEGGPTGKLKKYRRLLVLTGPAGAGKTATIQVLAKEMNITLTEWRNNLGISNDDEPPESLAHAFARFANINNSVLSHMFDSNAKGSWQPSRLLVFEDLPNVLHTSVREAFQSALEGLVNNPKAPPVVLIISEGGTRGMGGDGWRRDERWDIRNIVGPRLMASPYMTEVQFNPVAPTILHAALTRILSRTHPTANHLRPSAETLDLIAEGSMGDIRSAINALQFACRLQMAEAVKGGGSGKRKRGKKGKVGEEVRRIIEGVTRNEQVLVLFHILGKILYNKRFGDDPDEKDEIYPQESEQGVLPLPKHLSQFERRPSKVDVNTLYADSPVDFSLLSSYCHQNYPQFCSELEDLDTAAECVSYSEAFSLDSEHINVQLPEQAFHLLTRGLLMSLPSPVPRRGQKLLKSAYWEFSRKERDGLEVLRSWSRHDVGAARDHRSDEILERSWLLRRAGLRQPQAVADLAHMPWMPPVGGLGNGQELLDEGVVVADDPEPPISQRYKMEATDDEGDGDESDGGAWLDDDDIETD